MATYVIGDIQGCYTQLMALLDALNFDEKTDALWSVGDIVNRGPNSLLVLRFLKQLPHFKMVLGNHDLHLLALAYDAAQSVDTLEEVLTAPDRDELVSWLQQQPLLDYNSAHHTLLTHAGFYPFWTLDEAQACAQEVQTYLQGDHCATLLSKMYGDQPDTWSPHLTGWARMRFIINALTRMRFCTPQGKLEFSTKTPPTQPPPGYQPWFKLPNSLAPQTRLLFGHWAALEGKTGRANICGLDTGCVWGGRLTALHLEENRRISVPGQEVNA